MDSKNEIRPIGGMDMDSEARSLAPQDYAYGLNLRTAINVSARGGVLTNVQGNVKITKYTCPYTNGTNLPAGTNRCIGAFEDIKHNTVIFFNYNSTGKHGIYRLYRNKTTSDYPYGSVQEVMSYDWGWTKTTRITSASIVYGDADKGDLLYWWQPEPRKLNLNKANICEKFKEWTVFVPKSKAINNSYSFQIVVRGFSSNAIVASANIGLNAVDTALEFYTALAAEINTKLGTYLTATACDCSVTITEKAVNGYKITFTDGTFKVVPENWYGTTLIDRFWERIKWLPSQAPIPTYGKDTTTEANFVKNHVFQFRLRYIYDDYEYSRYGVISQIPTGNITCDGSTDTTYNYIDVDFNDPDLLNSTNLVLLKTVQVCAYDAVANAWRIIEDLDACEWWDYVDGQNVAHYQFYNNIAGTAIPDTDLNVQYDNVELEAQAGIFVKDRVIAGNVLTGYNPVECPKVDFKVKIEGDTTEYCTVSGRVMIYNPSATSLAPKPPTDESNLHGIIYKLSDDDDFGKNPQFGGVGTDQSYQSPSDQNLQQFTYGFTAYLAGSEYAATTKQVQVKNGVEGIYLPVIGENGILDAASGFSDIQTFLIAYQIYQKFEIRNVPKGFKGILRLAHHWATIDDVLDKGDNYNLNNKLGFQKTSAHVLGINPYNNGAYVGYTENVFEIYVDTTGGDVFVGDFIVADQRTIWSGQNDRKVICGFVNDGGDGNSTISALQQGAFVEKQLTDNTASNYTKNTYQSRGITDHNGYLFYTYVKTATVFDDTIAISVEAKDAAGGLVFLKQPTDICYYTTDSALRGLYNGSLTAANSLDLDAEKFYQIILPITEIAINNYKTIVKGKLVDTDGAGVYGILALFTGTGRLSYSDNDGDYQILIYADSTGSVGQLRQGNVIFNAGICLATFSDNNVYADIQPINDSSGYNLNNPFTITPNPIIISGFLTIMKARKRGGMYVVGLRYYDQGGRQWTTVPISELYIPDVTEDLSKFPYVVNGSGSPYTTPTYLGGVPHVLFSIDSTFKPPIEAATYQFMFTENLNISSYLQWVVNGVTYLSQTATETLPEVKTTFQNGDATAIKLNVSNIVTYGQRNQNSQISLPTIVAGVTRVRLLYNNDILLLNGIVDLEVTSYDNATQDIIVKAQSLPYEIVSGFKVQVFNPTSLASTDSRIYYECGEVYNCTAPNSINNQHATLNGTFTSGDTYWRARFMPVNDATTGFIAIYPEFIEAASISDFYSSTAQDIGRPGTYDKNFRQLRQPMLLQVTNTFQQGSAKNGLSTYEPLNVAYFDRATGQIQQFVFTNNTLIIVGSQREISAYLGQSILQQSNQAGNLVTVTDSFIGTPYIHNRLLGTDHIGSVVAYDGQVFGLANYIGSAWRYRGDGEGDISSVKMLNYFQGLSDAGIAEAQGVFDRYREEYLITVWRKYVAESTVSSIQNLTTAMKVVVSFHGYSLPKLNETVTFQWKNAGVWYEVTGTVTAISGENVSIQIASQRNLAVNDAVRITYALPETIRWFNGTDAVNSEKWVSFDSRTPEKWCSLGSEIFSFVNGEIWSEDKNPLYNNFYGVQYESAVTPIFNEVPRMNKVWQALWLMQYQENGGCAWRSDRITNSLKQLSRLKSANFVKIEPYYCIAFAKDLTDTTVTNPILNGRDLRDTYLKVEMQNDFNGEIVLYGWLAKYTGSEQIP